VLSVVRPTRGRRSLAVVSKKVQSASTGHFRRTLSRVVRPEDGIAKRCLGVARVC
jgi:hypothetical protein